MAEKKNRRASVQLNVRLEPAEAALIKRVIPKGSVRAVAVSLLVELCPPAGSRDADT